MSDENPDEPLNCPHCNVSLLGDAIPADIAEYYAGTHWKREIGIERPEIYDGIYHWLCLACNGTWGGYEALKNKLRSD